MRKYAANAAKKGADRKLFFYIAIAFIAMVVLFIAPGILRPPPSNPDLTPSVSPTITPEITAMPASPTPAFPSPTVVDIPIPQNTTRVFEGPDSSLIVTNEGGITCHAAIVSRELKIPCIVGTGIATKTIYSGDLIEVNANHGVVNILKRKLD